mgnify:CR=1 FL=1
MIDWDGIAEEADNSPRSLLAEVLSRADEITALVIIWRDHELNQYVALSTETYEQAIAMVELAKFNWLLDAKREVGEL